MTAHSMQCMHTHTCKCTACIYWAGFQGEEGAQNIFQGFHPHFVSNFGALVSPMSFQKHHL